MNIILATNNQNKVVELQNQLSNANLAFPILSLKDINIIEDIEETGTTFEENALIKAQYIATKFPNDIIIADDSGIEVDYLDLAPGIHSARFAMDEPKYLENPDLANNKKLLSKLDGITNRSARFRTCLAIIIPGSEPTFINGVVTGVITTSMQGEEGFGYDPIFTINGIKTFGQMSSVEKSNYSHRSQAIKNLIASNILSEVSNV